MQAMIRMRWAIAFALLCGSTAFAQQADDAPAPADPPAAQAPAPDEGQPDEPQVMHGNNRANVREDNSLGGVTNDDSLGGISDEKSPPARPTDTGRTEATTSDHL